MKHIERLVRFLRAVNVAHDGKNKPIAVRHCGRIFIWKAEEDTGWIEYKRARDVLSEYPRLVNILEKVGYI